MFSSFWTSSKPSTTKPTAQSHESLSEPPVIVSVTPPPTIILPTPTPAAAAVTVPKMSAPVARNTAVAAPGGPLPNSLELTIAATPETHLVYTNFIYVADNAANAALLTKRKGQTETYAKVNGRFIYVVRAHPMMTVGNVGLSSIQRQACDVQLGAPAQISYWAQPPDGGADLVTLKLDVELIGTKRVTIAAVDLAPVLIKNFAGQVFTKGQIFCCDFQGTPLKFTVENGEAGVPVSEQNKSLSKLSEKKGDLDESDDEAEEGAITKEVDVGVLGKLSKIELTSKTPSKFLTFKAEEAKKPSMLNPKFKFSNMGIGGLDAEFGMIFRRSFASRLFPAETTKKLGIKHVKGMLLYGPPGTGKTLIARQIGKILATKEPKVVNGPEILNKFVGASEENIRNLFKEAEEDTIANGDNAELHIIIFDEIDAICKARGRGGDSTGVHDTVVNQLLSKIDGVNALNNILVIGMTNRKDMIDPALLRPGRLEVHIEIGLPDEKGRCQIFNIHLKSMKENGFLGDDVSAEYLASQTKNFSGAEIEGLVKSAASFALYGSIDVKKNGAKPVDVTGKNIIVRMEHFERALGECKAAFGVDEDELKMYLRTDLLNYGAEYERIMRTCQTLINQVRTSKATPLLSLLLEGPNGSGKTSLAAKLAVDSGFPYVKVISPEQFVGYSELKKINDITKIFEDAYKSPLSLIILDSIERLLEYVAVGPRFSQAVLQTLLVLVNRIPPSANRKLMIIGTSSRASLLESLEITQAFNVVQTVAALSTPKQVEAVLTAIQLPATGGAAGIATIARDCFLPIPIKQLLMVAEMSRQEQTSVSPARFQECLEACGFDSGAAISLHSTIAAKNDLKFYTSSSSSTAAKKRRDEEDDEDDM